MSATADELTKEAASLYKAKAYEEAVLKTTAAVKSDPEKVDAWWYLGLSRAALNDHVAAVAALEKVTELAPEFAPGFSYLGREQSFAGDKESAKDNFRLALALKKNDVTGLVGLHNILHEENSKTNDEEHARILVELESECGLTSIQKNFIGIIHHRNKRIHDAIKYWRDLAYTDEHPASVFNLGLAYNAESVSQDADAIDMWRIALSKDSEYEPAKRELKSVLPRMLDLASNVRQQPPSLIRRENWYENYLNPYELIDFHSESEESFEDTKLIQRLKKTMLQELELEDGKLPWLEADHIDKSKAIGIVDELNDATKRHFHKLVFKNKPLMAFLSKGEHEMFLVNEHESPVEFILEVEANDDLKSWLGSLFVRQYDQVLAKAIEDRNVVVLESLLDGRRWVPEVKQLDCFTSARALIESMIEQIQDADKNADSHKYTAIEVERLLKSAKLDEILNLLPVYFEDYQDKVIHAIRGISVSTVNKHGDNEEALKIIKLAATFKFKSEHVNKQISEDLKAINDLIAQEREDEARYSSGSDPWEITKEGVRKGDVFIRAQDCASVRWGGLLDRNSSGGTTHRYVIAIESITGVKIDFSWNATGDVTKSEEINNQMVKAVLSYVLSHVHQRIQKTLDGGSSVKIGPCRCTKDGAEFEVKGWLFTNSHFVPWRNLRVKLASGVVYVQDVTNPKVKTEISFRDTPNAFILRMLAEAE